MRKAAKALFVVIVSLVSAIALSAASAFFAALAFGAVALIVPGTGTPKPADVHNYLENARNYYLGDTACGTVGACQDGDLQGIPYPASFWPLSIFPSWCRSGPDGCDKWDDSVGQGAAALTASLKAALNDESDPDQQVVIFGYSQGGAVVSKVLHDYGLTEDEKARIQVVTIGGIENPDGGLWQRLAFLRYIPILDINFNPPMPVDEALQTTTIGFEYDPVVYAPRYWGNAFAMLNALAAFATVHGYYLAPTGPPPPAAQDALPYGYTPATLAPQLVCHVGVNCRLDSAGNEYIMIPATSLPIMNLIMGATPAALMPIVKPLVDLISPAYKVLADLGYDWSGDPGVPTPLSILPFNPLQNWVKVGVDLAGAIGQGVQAALSDLGVGSKMIAPATTGSDSSITATSKMSLLSAAPSAGDPPVAEEDKPDSQKSTPATTLTLVPQDSDVVEQKGDDVVEQRDVRARRPPARPLSPW